MRRALALGVILACAAGSAAGCSVRVYRGFRSDREQIASLSGEVERLRALRDQDQQQLEAARQRLQAGLGAQEGVSVELGERGLVVTIVSEILFDSGKAALRAQSSPILATVAEVVRSQAGQRQVGIEGHTDDQPIRVSGWSSNWELSTARAIAVLQELERLSVPSERMRATGYGEHHPVASNRSAEGRQKNRRVEIILLPQLTENQRRLVEGS